MHQPHPSSDSPGSLGFKITPKRSLSFHASSPLVSLSSSPPNLKRRSSPRRRRSPMPSPGPIACEGSRVMVSEERASAGTVAESGNEAPMQPPSYGSRDSPSQDGKDIPTIMQNQPPVLLSPIQQRRIDKKSGTAKDYGLPCASSINQSDHSHMDDFVNEKITQKVSPGISLHQDMREKYQLVEALTPTVLTRTLMQPESLENGSVWSGQVAQMKEQGNTPTGRAEPLSSLESVVAGKDGERLMKASCESNDSHSNQEERPWKASMVPMQRNLYDLNHLKGTTIFIRRYDKGWLIFCDSRVSYIDAQGFFRIDMDIQLKCTLAAYLNHVTVSCGKVSVTKIFQSNIRAFICENKVQDFKKMWVSVEKKIKEALKRNFPTVSTEKQSGKLFVVNRANADHIMVIKARREAGALVFNLEAGTVSEWSDGSGYSRIKPIEAWPKKLPDLERASNILWKMISKASMLDKSTGGYGSCFYGGKDQEWSCHSCRELPDDPKLYGPLLLLS